MKTLIEQLAQFSPSQPADLIRKTSNALASLIEDELCDTMMSGAFPAPGNRQLCLYFSEGASPSIRRTTEAERLLMEEQVHQLRFSITIPKNVDGLDVVNVMQNGAMPFWISAALAFWSMCKHMELGKEDIFSVAEADFNRDLDVLMVAFEAVAAGRNK